MADEVIQAPPIETPSPPPEPMDETGVPYKNRVAEMNRKLEDANRLNQEYQLQLGRLMAQQQVPPKVDEPLEDKFDDVTRKYVEATAQKVAEQVAHRFISQAQVSQTVNADPELLNIAKEEYGQLKANPYYSNLRDDQLQAFAVASAESKLLKKRGSTQQDANRAAALRDAAKLQAEGASLPDTGSSLPSGSVNKEEFIKKFKANDDQRAMVQSYWEVDPDSMEGQLHLQRAAEKAFSGGQFQSSKIVNEVMRQIRQKDGGAV